MNTGSSLYSALINTSEELGFKVVSDERCCELMAFVYYFGHESVIFDEKLNADVLHAQKRLNLYGGETPNPDLLPMLKEKIKELVRATAEHALIIKAAKDKHKSLEDKMAASNNVPGIKWPEWLIKLAKDYKIPVEELRL